MGWPRLAASGGQEWPQLGANLGPSFDRRIADSQTAKRPSPSPLAALAASRVLSAGYQDGVRTGAPSIAYGARRSFWGHASLPRGGT
jgi:hypothetical protein